MFLKTIAVSLTSFIPLLLLMSGTADPRKAEAKDQDTALPNSTNGELKKLWAKAKPYKHTQAYQHQQSTGIGQVEAVTWLPGIDRIETDRGHKRSNTHEFPWVNTAGFEGGTQKYVYLPDGEHIEYTDTTGRWPDHGDVERVVEWRYPPGTVFAETLTTHGRIFEVRTRTKGDNGKWRANVYRPYADAKDLQDKLHALGTRDARRLALAIADLPRKEVKITHPHDVKTFEFKGIREDLPEIPESLAETILGWDFVANAEWKTDCFAPSTRSDSLSIVSKDYAGFSVRPDSKGCMQCHDSTLQHAFTLERNRDWYGRVRGSDGIFSFHIFQNNTITTDGANPVMVKLNTDLPLKKVEKFK